MTFFPSEKNKNNIKFEFSLRLFFSPTTVKLIIIILHHLDNLNTYRQGHLDTHPQAHSDLFQPHWPITLQHDILVAENSKVSQGVGQTIDIKRVKSIRSVIKATHDARIFCQVQAKLNQTLWQFTYTLFEKTRASEIKFEQSFWELASRWERELKLCAVEENGLESGRQPLEYFTACLEEESYLETWLAIKLRGVVILTFRKD
jgi:hypothetical protein